MGSGGPDSRVSWIQQFIMVTISEIGYYFLFNWPKLFTPSSLPCTLAMQICSRYLSRLRTTVESPFRGHPRNQDTCSPNGDVPSIEGTHTKIIWTIEGRGGANFVSVLRHCLSSKLVQFTIGWSNFSDHGFQKPLRKPVRVYGIDARASKMKAILESHKTLPVLEFQYFETLLQSQRKEGDLH